jgi:hypothetical protein
MDATLPELELQQELERFTTQFTDRITQATATLDRSGGQGVGDEALRKNLLYVSSAIEIATGPDPEINLLDMIVFIRLSRRVLEKHWIPKLYGQQGAELAEVFAKAERELSDVADRTLSAVQRDQVVSLVDSWLADNPAQVRVEGVRLADFSAAAGNAAAERSMQVKGLLSSLKVAARTANQAMLLSERGLFLVHRLPFLWRLQARLAAREMLSDAITRLADGPRAPLGRLTREAGRLAWRGLLYVGLLGAVGMLVLRPGSLARR